MKPDGRSLDIVVIGLGQAGGNIATEFFRRGYSALALNTAQSDLTALDPGGVYPALPAERRLYIGLDGYDGAGADPGYGSECVMEHALQIREAVMREAADADAVIIAAGLGGGTGSSLAALARVLEPEGLPLVALATLPSGNESGITKVNAMRAINELVAMPLLGWIFVDNSRLAELNQDVSIVDYFAHVNGQIASPIDALNRLNDRHDLKSIRSFDGEDLRKLLLSGGVMSYGVVELPNVTVDEVVGALRDSLESSDLMPAGFDMASVSYLGLVVEATDAALAETPISTFEKIDAEVKRETGGAATYRGIYRTNDESRPTLLRYMCACQSLPQRMRDILADARREGGAIRDKLQVEVHSLDLGEVGDFELFRPGAKNRASERPRRAVGRSSVPPPSSPIEDLRVDIMRPNRPAQSPQVKRLSGRARPLTPSSPGERTGGSASSDKTGGPGSDKPGPASGPESPRSPTPAQVGTGDLPPLAPAMPTPSMLRRSTKPAAGGATPTVPPPPAPPASLSPPLGIQASPTLAGPLPGVATNVPLVAPPPASTSSASSAGSGVSMGGSAAAKAKPASPISTVPPPPSPPASEIKSALEAKAAKKSLPPIPIDESSLLDEPTPESVTHEIDIEAHFARQMREPSVVAVSTPAPPPPPPFDGEDSSGLPSPEVYDKLVSDFLHSDDDERRDDIADRLEADSQSEQTVIRYYAVEAMSKLGREVFGSALLNATEDENEAVRAIAVEALRR